MNHEQAKAVRDQVVELTRFLPIRQVCAIAGFSKSTILRKIEDGDFPAPVIQEGNVTRWDAAEVQQWRAEQFKKREQRMAQPKREAVAA